MRRHCKPGGPMPDLVIVAAAALQDATVLYDDCDFDLIAAWSPLKPPDRSSCPGPRPPGPGIKCTSCRAGRTSPTGGRRARSDLAAQIRVHDSGHSYRVFDVASIGDTVYVLHCFQEESPQAATEGIDLGKR